MESFKADISYGIRLLRKNAGISLIIVLSIAIGVSVNATVFCWIESIILKPLPTVPNSDKLVTFVTKTQSDEYITSSYSDYKDYRDQSTSLAGLAAFEERPLSVENQGQTQTVWAMLVSNNFFDILGIKPSAGHFFLQEEQVDTSGSAPVAVISYDFWTRYFGKDPRVLNRAIKLNGQDVTVVGIGPKDFRGPIVGSSFDVWLPLLLQDRLTGSSGEWVTLRKWRSLHALGRLAPGSSIESAQAEMNLISARLARSYPDQNAGMSAILFPFAKTPYGTQSILAQLLKVLLLATFAVLLIVCSNLANLLLVRATEREKEISIRMALGAEHGRIFRQLLTESVVLSVLAAALSLLFIYKLSELLQYFIPATDIPLSLTPTLDLKTLIFAFVLSVTAGLASSLFPALRSARIEVVTVLKESGRGLTAGRGKHLLRMGLATSEIALALVALVGAGLLVKSFHNISRLDPGFDSEHVLLVGMTSSNPGTQVSDLAEYYERAKERLRSLPSVRAVSYAEWVPLGLRGGSWEDIEIEGYSPRSQENMKIYRNLVDDDYFGAMKIPLLEGRTFDRRDDWRHWTDASVPAVAIVNETFVKRFISSQNPIGHHIRGWGKTLTIVGIVKDSKYATPTEAPLPYLYVPFRQFAGSDTSVILHIAVDGAPEAVMSAVRREMYPLNSLASVSYVMPLKEYIGAAVFKNRLAAILLSILGITALILAMLGIYGVMSQSVAQRAHEIGIRVALGASAKTIVTLIVFQGARLAMTGVGMGILLSLLLSRILTTFLYGVNAFDAGTILAVSFLLLAVALLATSIPAYRASRVDSVKLLRL